MRLDSGEGAVLIARHDEWTLFEFPEKAGDGWRALKLVSKEPHKKRGKWRAFWFGWNGERLSRNSYTQRLDEIETDLRDWLLDVLQGARA